MPHLHNLGVKRDLESSMEFSKSPDFNPDGLKLYLTLTFRGTWLYELYLNA